MIDAGEKNEILLRYMYLAENRADNFWITIKGNRIGIGRDDLVREGRMLTWTFWSRKLNTAARVLMEKEPARRMWFSARQHCEADPNRSA